VENYNIPVYVHMI